MASVIRTILTILFAIDSIVLIVVVLMQQGKDRGDARICKGSSISQCCKYYSTYKSAKVNLSFAA